MDLLLGCFHCVPEFLNTINPADINHVYCLNILTFNHDDVQIPIRL